MSQSTRWLVVVAVCLGTACGGSGNEDDYGFDFQWQPDATSEEARTTVPEVPVCTPECGQRMCGPDGCDGSCGNCFSLEGAIDNTLCMEDGQCCQPDCDGKECGENGCGGNCGACGAQSSCLEGACVPDCVPDCEGKDCGPDACGGECGYCDDWDTCNYEGLCIANCAPDCDDKECGSDGCDGKCGTCTGGDKCYDGVCGPCVIDCQDKECGFDGCVGTCGACPENGKCDDGLCECKYGYVESPGGDACWPECPEGAVNDPESGECECPVGQHWAPEETGCWEDCPEGAENEAGTGECVCPDGLEWSPGGDACWPVCAENSQWVPDNGMCECVEDALVGLDGEACVLECAAGSHEAEGVCICDEGTLFDEAAVECLVPPLYCDLGSTTYALPDAYEVQRFERTFADGEIHPVINDLSTGLMWMGCDAGQTGGECSQGFLSLKKPAAAAAFCADSQWGGYDDWKLPRMVDWLAVVDNGLSAQTGPESFFAFVNEIEVDDTYWSSTKPEYITCNQECFLGLMRDDPAEFGFQWYIQYAYATFGRRVRCVREPLEPAEHCGHVISGGSAERVIYLSNANIFWQGCAAGQSGKECAAGNADIMSRPDAQQYCEELQWGGFDDWLLPDLNYFLSLVDFGVPDKPLVDPDLVPEMNHKTCWSSTQASGEDDGWTFDFGAGQAVNTGQDLTWSVRCVRLCPGNFAGVDCSTCAPGFEGDGCDVMVGCEGEPCFPGVDCTDIPGFGFECAECPVGFEGDGVICQDVDGCAESPCFEGVDCFDAVAPEVGFACGDCPDGTFGDGEVCSEIIPCQEDSNCGDHAQCLEVQSGVFSCACDLGWEWTGELCASDPLGFVSAASFTTASWPWDVEAGDFNDDGFQDIVVTALLSDKLHVYLGDGGMGGAMSFSTECGDKPRGLALADFNSDDNLDIAVSRESDADVRLYYGSGDGTFSGGAFLQVASAPRTVAVADLNNDGVEDLVTGHDFSVGVSVLLGLLGGGFAESFLVESWGHGHWELATADFDQDGSLDLLLPDSSGDKAKVMFGNGAGFFGEPLSIDLSGGPFGVATGDLNGDGAADAVLGIKEKSGEVAVILGDGEGGFSEPTYLASGEDPRDVEVADFNGDGNLDIASTIYGNDAVRVFYGDGAGGFPDTLDLSQVGDVEIKGPAMLTVADYDGNGHPDIIVASQMNNTVVIIFN